MTHPLLKTTLVSATMLCLVTAFASAAFPQAPGPHVRPAEVASDAPPLMDHGHRAAGPRGPHHGPHALELAATLAAAELYVGITPEQLGAWRSYTSALIALLDFGPGAPPATSDRPDNGPEVSHPVENGAKAAPQPAHGMFGEDIADQLLLASEKAKVFKDAAASLRAVLTSEQAGKLDILRHTLLPPPAGDGTEDGEAPEFGPGSQN